MASLIREKEALFPCVGAILVQAQRLLLGRRSRHLRSYPNCWDVIGGHVQVGETLESALVREMEEEIGVTPIRFAKLASLGFTDASNRPCQLHVYRVEEWRGGSPVIRNHEHSELRWFTVEQACALSDLASNEFVPLFRALEHSLLDSRLNTATF